jgi:GNAT superfamily N-acetyltransferase
MTSADRTRNDSSFEIRLSHAITDDERHILLGWGNDIFGIDHLNWHGRKKEWHMMGYVDGQLVSHAGILKDVVHVAQQPVTVGGVGAVITIPMAQRKGYAHALLRQAATFMRDTLQVEFGLLFCLPRLIAFYRSLDWQEVTSPVFIEQPVGRMASPVPVMYLPCRTTGDWPAGMLEIGLPW